LGAAAAMALPALPQLTALAEPAAGEGTFSFPLLGDLHFDRLAHHDMEWLKREKANDTRQVENYSRITADIVPGLMTEIGALIAAATAPVPFVAHVGDFVEGLCGKAELARMQCEEAVACVRAAKFNRPFLITKGNHDVTGPGAAEAYQQVVLPFLRDPMLSDPSGASFAVEHQGALFAFFDSYDRKSLPWFEALLTQRRPDPAQGRLFVIIHQPVVPYTGRLWHVYERAQDAKDRQRLLDLLGRHRAIVINGHLHKYGLLARKTETGRFVQLSVSSVIGSKDFKPRQVLQGVDQYGPGLLNLEPDFSPTTADHRRDALKAEAPQIDHYEHADAPGYAMVNVTPQRVTADLYVGLGKRLWKTVDLTALLAAPARA
jgi:hypothetical protein